MNFINHKNHGLRTLPVIPLRGNVAFPHTHYHIEALNGCAAYAFAEAINKGDDVLLLTQQDITQDTLDIESFFSVGTICKVKKVTKNSETSHSVIFECLHRGVVIHMSANEKAFYALVSEVHDTATPDAATDEMREKISLLRDLLLQIKSYVPEPAGTSYIAASSIDDISVLCDFLASNMLSDYRAKQLILDEVDSTERLDILIEALRFEAERLSCDASIQQTVKDNIEENQREYYLREQLKAIRSELGDEDSELQEYSDAIERAALPEEVREKLLKELGRLAKAPMGSADSTVLRNYLDICLDIPWGITADDGVSVASAKEILDADHDGLDKVKERILEYIAVRKITDSVKSQILCLVGPPGVGKTSIAISIAKAMSRPYSRISLGGVRDEADIRGHRKTYVGAMPGRIIEAITHAKAMNPVIILDEIDKLSSSQMGDPASALLEVLDPEQNKNFRDHFVELPTDLSNCIFIATANYYGGIPAPLLDRMEVIELNSYTDTEKFNIAIHHLIPKQLEAHGLTGKGLRFSDEGIYEMIRHYTKEAGVRHLEREIATICRKFAKKLADGTAKTATITPKTLKQYLGAPRYADETLDPVAPIGVVNGLAYTSAGGDLLKVEVLVMEGTGKIELTGSLGDVMKESAKIAISYVRSIADKLHIDPKFYSTKDIHIHFPEGAIPKDGPSAGVTMTCAIVSALTSLPTRPNVAMTGEVTLRGKVMPIGGLKEKTMAAYRSGIKSVLIPRQNAKDLDEIDPVVREGLRFVLLDTAEDAINHVILSDHTPLLPATPVGGSVKGAITPKTAKSRKK